jgi:hypothetical protein
VNLITFGLGGAKAAFLRLGFGASARVAQSKVDGGVLRGQFRPVIFNPPILLDVQQVSRVRLRVRFTSKCEVSCGVSRVRPIVGDGGFARGSRGERAFHELQRTAKDLNSIAAMVDSFCKRYEGDRTMTKNDRELLHNTAAFLKATMTRYRALADGLREPRQHFVEANAYEVLERYARKQRAERDAQDVRDMVAVIEGADEAIYRAQVM